MQGFERPLDEINLFWRCSSPLKGVCVKIFFLCNPEKAQLFAKSVERNFCIESHLLQKSHFDRINKFVEAHSYHFTPLDSHDNVTDTDDNSDLVADVDPDTLIRIVRTELKNDKAPGIDNVYNDILKKAIGTGFYKLLARTFTISLKLGFIRYVWSSLLYAHQAWKTTFTNYLLSTL